MKIVVFAKTSWYILVLRAVRHPIRTLAFLSHALLAPTVYDTHMLVWVMPLVLLLTTLRILQD